MKRARKVIWSLATLVLLGALISTLVPLAKAQAQLQLPERPQGFVSDFANMLSASTVQELEGRLSGYERETTNEIAVVTVEDLQETTIEDYAVRLFEKWQIGKAGKDNGVLLLIAESERQIRIEVGYGLEPTLTDAEAYGIISRKISPAFKEGDYDEGVRSGVDEIIKGLSGAELPEGSPPSDGDGGGITSGILAFIIFIIIAGIQWLGAVLARSKSWWAGGMIGGIIGVLIAGFVSVVIGLIALPLLVALGLFWDYIISKNYKKSKAEGRKTPWWAGGSWGPFTGGRGGGRGFGGFGGGRSGGGGATGGW